MLEDAMMKQFSRLHSSSRWFIILAILFVSPEAIVEAVNTEGRPINPQTGGKPIGKPIKPDKRVKNIDLKLAGEAPSIYVTADGPRFTTVEPDEVMFPLEVQAQCEGHRGINEAFIGYGTVDYIPVYVKKNRIVEYDPKWFTQKLGEPATGEARTSLGQSSLPPTHVIFKVPADKFANGAISACMRESSDHLYRGIIHAKTPLQFVVHCRPISKADKRRYSVKEQYKGWKTTGGYFPYEIHCSPKPVPRTKFGTRSSGIDPGRVRER
jgi:hypothetical protein